MATARRRKIASVVEKLFSEPYRYTFFQAVRVLQNLARSKNKDNNKGYGPVGYDVTLDKEAAHFSASQRLSYPGTEISAINIPAKTKSSNASPPNVVVNFLGLTGPKGILPTHYTELQQQRYREKDTAIFDFFNVINHRAISFFYRAWQKYQLPVLYELHNHYPVLGSTDAITKVLHSLVGNGDETVRNQLPIAAENILYFAGHYCSFRRSAPSLELLLKTFFQIPVQLHQFEGEWVDNAPDDRVQIGAGRRGRNNQLGVNVILGTKVYIVEGKFQLELGPLSKQQFESIKPGGERIKALCRLTQSFVGPELLFNLRMKVSSEAITGFGFGAGSGVDPQLGWNTWLISEASGHHRIRTIEEIVIPASGLM